MDLPPTEGADTQAVLLRWAANAPLIMLDQYHANLQKYSAIAIDVGDQDYLGADASRLQKRMELMGVSTTFQVYSGDHASEVAERWQNHVLPFFGRLFSL